ncbi:hypothetical protein [Caldilinea sp.]|uniref:hypothetical protein n=1 Tax=Caldilinea sp. TaxID=2293560 RepID=UPI002C836979|nr:hypothetical protein [Caldilinea sp.]HRA64960.1 hypothetical protein [Caldilinea sp.]
MAHTVESRISTPAAELRDLLDQAERQVHALDRTTIADYLVRLDRIDALFAQIQTDQAARGPGTDQALRSEMGRWTDLQEKIERRNTQFVKAANTVGGYPALRAQHPPAAGAWWHLDAHVAMQRRKKLRQLLQTLAIVAVLALVGAWAYQTWLAPDPETIAFVSALNTLEQHVDAGELDAALAVAESALQTLPTNTELLVWAAVLSERLGDEAGAGQYNARAQAQLDGNNLQFHLMVGMARFRAGDLDGATDAATLASGIDPEEPQVYFLLGNIAETRGDLSAALDAFDRAATLAEADNAQLAVVSKMRYGMLLQQFQMPGAEQSPLDTSGDATATPTATPSP